MTIHCIIGIIQSSVRQVNAVLSFHGLKLNNKQPVYIQIARYVKLQIVRGNAASGHKLPSRRETAAQLQVNPNTVQKAYRLMEEEGYVHTDSTLGSIIRADEETMKRMELELTNELVSEFISEAKEMNLSFKRVIELISEQWEQDG